MFSKLNVILTQFLAFLILIVRDAYYFRKNKEYLNFRAWGLHIYCGKFGSGKTSSMVHDAYELAKKYKMLKILTNMELKNFPLHTEIIELEHFRQIVDAENNTLIIIDELATIFNSRDWKNDGVPAPVLGTLLQQRKKNIMIYATAQVFTHVDSLMRQITFTVRDCKCIMGRWNLVSVYDPLDFEARMTNLDLKPKLVKFYGFIQNDFYRRLYDTTEMVEKMKKTKYISEVEILGRQNKVFDFKKA